LCQSTKSNTESKWQCSSEISCGRLPDILTIFQFFLCSSGGKTTLTHTDGIIGGINLLLTLRPPAWQASSDETSAMNNTTNTIGVC